MKRSIYVVTLALSLIPAMPAHAQDSTGGGGGGGFCFRGRPRPKCGTFMLTEFTTRAPLGRAADASLAITELELGVMTNVGRSGAIGGAVIFGGEESRRRTGVGLRYRRWLTRSLGAEVGARWFSVCEQSGPSTCERARGGFGTQAALNLSDYAGLTIAYERINAGSNKPGEPMVWSYPAESQVTAGLKFGYYVAPVVLVGLGALIAATW